jgi:hypothetical protein
MRKSGVSFMGGMPIMGAESPGGSAMVTIEYCKV